MTKLRDLERRLREEPDNLGLRVAFASALHEAGRHADAVDLYRSVAIAYRNEGRSQQAIAVCRSILEIAPDDATSHALLATLVAGHRSATQPSPAPGLGRAVLEVGLPPPLPAPPPAAPAAQAPPRRRATSSMDETPLPPAMPHHIADPTQRLARISESELPTSEGAVTRPGSEDGTLTGISGIASAARRISATLIRARTRNDDDEPQIELDTGGHRLPRPGADDDSIPPPTRPVVRAVGSGTGAAGGAPGAAGADAVPDARDDEDDETRPRDLPVGLHRPGQPARPAARSAQGPIAFAFFAPLPIERRAAVLSRFSRRSVPAGTVVMRRGEPASAFVMVASGRLEVRAERGGQVIELGSIGPGEYIGEAPLLARAAVRTTVIAATEAELLLLAPRDFYEIAGAFPALWAALKEVAERRTRELDGRR